MNEIQELYDKYSAPNGKQPVDPKSIYSLMNRADPTSLTVKQKLLMEVGGIISSSRSNVGKQIRNNKGTITYEPDSAMK